MSYHECCSGIIHGSGEHVHGGHRGSLYFQKIDNSQNILDGSGPEFDRPVGGVNENHTESH